jgi:hypothetical protein
MRDSLRVWVVSANKRWYTMAYTYSALSADRHVGHHGASPLVDIPAVRLYVGGHAGTIQGEPVNLSGYRCFTPVHNPPRHADPSGLSYLLDSGAFSDPPAARLTPATALERQLSWEERAARVWGVHVPAEALVSYDRLIDEIWVDGFRVKRRWSEAEAWSAVEETVEAAAYLASQRERLRPRALVLAIQGVTAEQYVACAERVLAVAHPDDWLGLGGWCILGRWRSWLPEWFRTIQLVVPRAARSGIRRIHVFGVLYLPALGPLVWLADRYGLAVSTDSTAPLLAAAGRNLAKAGARCHYWRENVRWWIETLAKLRDTPYYHPPPLLVQQLQLALNQGLT